MTKRIKVKSFALTRADLERALIKHFNLPNDIVVTKIDSFINQEAWFILVQSSEFEEQRDIDLIDTKITPDNNLGAVLND